MRASSSIVLLALVGCSPQATSSNKQDEPARPSSEAVVDESTPEVVEVATSSEATCARLADASLRCWGSQDHGGAGPSGSDDAVAPIPIDLGMPVARIFGLHAGFCARGSDERMACWGGARGVPGDRYKKGLRFVDELAGATAIVAREDRACAVTKDMLVACWGKLSGEYGMEGIGQPAKTSDVPEVVKGVEKVVELALGRVETCARTDDGSVWCWGRGEQGFWPLRAPAKVEGVVATSLRAPATWDDIMCAATQDGEVCWQRGPAGERVREFEELPAIAAAHTCSLTQGRVSCSGSNRRGQLGLGDLIDRATPTDLPASSFSLASGRAALKQGWTTPPADGPAFTLPELPPECSSNALKASVESHLGKLEKLEIASAYARQTSPNQLDVYLADYLQDPAQLGVAERGTRSSFRLTLRPGGAMGIGIGIGTPKADPPLKPGTYSLGKHSADAGAGKLVLAQRRGEAQIFAGNSPLPQSSVELTHLGSDLACGRISIRYELQSVEGTFAARLVP